MDNKILSVSLKGNIMTYKSEEIIRETMSTCHLCYKKIKAYLIEKDKKICLKKHCPKHGGFELVVSKHPWYYKGLTEYYFKVMPVKMKQRRFYIYLSNKCNMNCPICLLQPNQNRISDISLSRFEETIKKNRSSRFYLYGAEPTLRSDFVQWILLLKRYGNMVNMHTNGIKLQDYEYLKTLKDCGLDYVSLQFDGFNDKIYNVLRGRSLLSIKLKALENLRKLNISTGLNVTIARGVNEDQIKEIIEYAVSNPFIRDVSFATLSFLGSTNNNFSFDAFLMPDELIDIVDKETEGKISRRNIFLFQKLYYALLSIFNVRRCYNFHHIALIRDKNKGYLTFDTFFKLEQFEKKLDTYKELVKRSRKLAASYFFVQLFFNFLKSNILTKLSCIPANIIIPGKVINLKIPSKVLLVSFGTVCDFYKYDSQIAQYCGQGFCLEDNNNAILTDSISEVSLFYKRGSCD